MNKLVILCCLATLAVLPSSSAQTIQRSRNNDQAEDAINSMSSIRRPTPSPTAAAATTNKGAAKPLEARLTKDQQGKQDSTTFPAASEKIYLQFLDPGATKGEQLKVVWVAEDVKYYKTKNKKVHEYAQTMPGPNTGGALFLDRPQGMASFPDGKYRADVYVAGKQVKSLKFTVAK